MIASGLSLFARQELSCFAVVFPDTTHKQKREHQALTVLPSSIFIDLFGYLA
jgi:hypothetical protein